MISIIKLIHNPVRKERHDNGQVGKVVFIKSNTSLICLAHTASFCLVITAGVLDILWLSEG